MRERIVRVGLLALSALVLTACKSGTKDYLTVSFTGYDGYGEAVVSLDKEDLILDLYGKDATEEEQKAVAAGVSVSVDGGEALHNGDEVEVTVDVDKESAVASKLKSASYRYDVSGLKKTTKISSADFTKKLTVDYKGLSGEAGYPTIALDAYELYPVGENGDDLLKPAKSNQPPLSNGEKIGFDVEVEQVASLTGYVLTDKKPLAFEVSDLDKVPDKVSEIQNLADVLARAQEQAEEDFEAASLASHYSLVRRNVFYRRQYQEVSGWRNSYYGDLAVVYEYHDAQEDSFVKTATNFVVYNFAKLVIDKDGLVALEEASELDRTKMVPLSAESDKYYRERIEEVYQSLTHVDYQDVTEEVDKLVQGQTKTVKETPKASKGMDVAAILKGDYSSVAGTWATKSQELTFTDKGLDIPTSQLEVTQLESGALRIYVTTAASGFTIYMAPAGVRLAANDASDDSKDRIWSGQNEAFDYPDAFYYKVD